VRLAKKTQLRTTRAKTRACSSPLIKLHATKEGASGSAATARLTGCLQGMQRHSYGGAGDRATPNLGSLLTNGIILCRYQQCLPRQVKPGLSCIQTSSKRMAGFCCQLCAAVHPVGILSAVQML